MDVEGQLKVQIYGLSLLLGCACWAQTGEYEGPSILSRNKSLTGERAGKLLDFRFYGEVTGIYDDGLTPVSVQPNGSVLNPGAQEGIEAGFGVIGSRQWKNDFLSVDYHGAFRDYTSKSYYDGTDQFFDLEYGRQIARHVSLTLTGTAGSLSRSSGVFSFASLRDTDLFAVPANELFDNRTMYAQPGATLVWQKTRRLSLSVGGDGFLVRRRSSALAGLDGGRARVDAAYRLDRRQTLSASYDLTDFSYQGAFGHALMHSFAGGYGVGLGRMWDFSSMFGAIRISTAGVTNVTVDPAIAAIIGHTTATVAFFKTSWLPLIDARLIRRFEKASLAFNFTHGVSPGNGVFLASSQNAAAANYSYAGYRRFTFGGTAGYSDLNSFGQGIGKYSNLQGGAGLTYKVSGPLHMEFRYDARHYTTQNRLYSKNENRVTLGLAFSPGEVPLSIF